MSGNHSLFNLYICPLSLSALIIKNAISSKAKGMCFMLNFGLHVTHIKHSEFD